jgi:hypothetical protein
MAETTTQQRKKKQDDKNGENHASFPPSLGG